MANTSKSTVTIVGAGPVAIYTAYLLWKEGISVHVYEKETRDVDSPRAIVQLSPTLDDLSRSGIYEQVLAAGATNKTGQQWRRCQDRKVLASLQHPLGKVMTVTLGQHELVAPMLREMQQFQNWKVHFSLAVNWLEVTADRVEGAVYGQPMEREHTTQFLVSDDGGRSTVRKQLSISFEGFTWEDFHMVAANIDYDVSEHTGWGTASYVCDPEHWGVVLYSGQGTVWQVAKGRRLVPGHEDDWEFEAER